MGFFIQKQRWLLALKKTNQDTQKVKHERFLISTRQNKMCEFSAHVAFYKAADRQRDIQHQKGLTTYLNVTVEDRSWNAFSFAKIEFGKD